MKKRQLLKNRKALLSKDSLKYRVLLEKISELNSLPIPTGLNEYMDDSNECKLNNDIDSMLYKLKASNIFYKFGLKEIIDCYDWSKVTENDFRFDSLKDFMLKEHQKLVENIAIRFIFYSSVHYDKFKATYTSKMYLERIS